jgi:hypothetical protein
MESSEFTKLGDGPFDAVSELHLWRPTSQPIPLPPDILVGIKGMQLYS